MDLDASEVDRLRAEVSLAASAGELQASLDRVRSGGYLVEFVRLCVWGGVLVFYY